MRLSTGTSLIDTESYKYCLTVFITIQKLKHEIASTKTVWAVYTFHLKYVSADVTVMKRILAER